MLRTSGRARCANAHNETPIIVNQPTTDQVNGALRSNLKSVTHWSTPVTVYSAGAAAAVTVMHDLGAIPNTIEIESYVDTRWWADQDDRKVWTVSTILFRTGHAGRFVVRAGVQ